MEPEISKRGKLIRDMVYEFNHNHKLKDRFVEETRDVSDIDKQFNYPDYIKARVIELENFKMELIKRDNSELPEQEVRPSKNKKDYVILQFHGGGYVNAFKNNYRRMAGLYMEAADGADVLSVDYRVAPKNPFPAALYDAVVAYDWLIEHGYSEASIILAGDSAGGGLSMALCHYLKDRDRVLPAGIIAMSPWVDLAATGRSYTENSEIDPIFGNDEGGLIFNNPYPGAHDRTDPYISPLYGDFEGFPPMLVQVGTHEMLYSDAEEVCRKAKKAGVKVRFSVYDGMFHVFQMAARLMPEANEAWTEVKGFINAIDVLNKS